MDGQDEVFEIDDPVPGLVELPMEVGLAAADGDVAAWAPAFWGQMSTRILG